MNSRNKLLLLFWNSTDLQISCDLQIINMRKEKFNIILYWNTQLYTVYCQWTEKWEPDSDNTTMTEKTNLDNFYEDYTASSFKETLYTEYMYNSQWPTSVTQPEISSLVCIRSVSQLHF